MRKRGHQSIRTAGIALIVRGGLLIMCFVPLWIWMIALGTVLVGIGLAFLWKRC